MAGKHRACARHAHPVRDKARPITAKADAVVALVAPFCVAEG
jgi:hypothetical protein